MSQAKLEIINIVLKQDNLHMDGCLCSVCTKEIITNTVQQIEGEQNINCFEMFLKELPSFVTLCIEPTTFYKPQTMSHFHYFNGTKANNSKYIYKNKTSKVLMNFPGAQNIHIYGENVNKLLCRAQAMNFIKKIDQRGTLKRKKSFAQAALNKIGEPLTKCLYIQRYISQVPIKVHYDVENIQTILDNILWEYLEEEKLNFHRDKTHVINEEFWQWVYTEYGQNVFAYFISQFYVHIFDFYSGNSLTKALFFWVFEYPKSEFGENTKVTQEQSKSKKAAQQQYFVIKSKKLGFKIKLINVMNMNIKYHEHLKSFQEEYQEMIIEKIRSESQIKLGTNSTKKQYLYNSRISSFQSKVRTLFLSEQNKVLNKVEKEKQYEGKEDSNKLAKLLLPGMRENQEIRQILNDQCAFQRLILVQDKKREAERIKKARLKLLSQKRELLQKQRQQTSFDSSKISVHRSNLPNTRRMRLKTTFL